MKLTTALTALDDILEENTAFITYRYEAELKEKLEQADLLLKSSVINLNQADKAILTGTIEIIRNWPNYNLKEDFN